MKKGIHMPTMNKDNIEEKTLPGDDEPVYEGEIIDPDDPVDKDREHTALVKKEEKPPVRRLAYNLGKLAGSLIASVGVLAEALNLFKSENNSPDRTGNKSPGRGQRRMDGRGRGRGLGCGRGSGRGSGRGGG